MLILELYYKIRKKNIPYYARYSLLKIVTKPIIKYINVVLIPHTPFNCLRILLYRMIGYRIGKNVFIGMKSYLDDLDPKMLTIENNVVISYGCYFCCHGKNQTHTPIVIKEGSYLGMRVNIISGRKGLTIGPKSIIAAGATVVRDIAPNTTVAGVPAKELP